MAKVLLLAPPYLDLYGKLSKAAGRYFPLGLAYIASYVRKYGQHDVRMYEPEAQGLSYDDIGIIVREFAPDVIGLTSSTPNFPRALKLAGLCKQIAPHVPVVLGGVHCTAMPEFIVSNHRDVIDAVVVGEGEEAMLELVEVYEKGLTASGIKGVVYDDGKKVINNGQRPYIDDLDVIPWPARDLIPQDLFVPNSHNARHPKCVSILTSRGCPFNCTFCAARIVSGTRYRVHSAEYVLEEMEMLVRDYGTRQLLITDDTFTLNKARLYEICEGMIERKLNLKWFCFSQVNAVDLKTLKLMARAGCYNIGFGVESSEPEILAKMGKNIKPEQAVRAVREANSVGMKTQAFYVFGTPGETRQQMERTVEFSKKVGATLSFFNMLVPFPGTKEFEYYFKDTKLEDIEWENFVAIGEKCVLDEKSGISPNDIEKLIARANMSYFLHPLRLLRVLLQIRTTFELVHYIRGGIGFAKQIFGWLSK